MKPRRISKRTHNLNLECFDADAIKVIHTLRKAGHIAYIVGGSIRDLLLGNQPKDFDISTSAKPEEIKQLFRNCILIGRRFRLAHLRYGKKVLEVATFRKGDTEKSDLIIQDNVWGSPEEDVIRRDFTINALFYDPESETIIDYIGGYKDAENRFLQTIGDPYIRFKQDPVRMIRCLKFQARFHLQADGRMHQALEDCRQELVHSSQARIFEELVRMLESGSSRNFYHLMHRTKMLEILQPDLACFLNVDKRFEIFSFLDEADVRMLDTSKPLCRPILLSCLVFPVLNKHLQTMAKQSEKPIHLGQVQKETSEIIDTIFRPFFHLPKRIKAKMVSLLTTQFRLTPLYETNKSRIRIPRTPDFFLGLEFLELRSKIEPGYRMILEEWTEVYKSRGSSHKEPRRRPSRRYSSYRKKGEKQ